MIAQRCKAAVVDELAITCQSSVFPRQIDELVRRAAQPALRVI